MDKQKQWNRYCQKKKNSLFAPLQKKQGKNIKKTTVYVHGAKRPVLS